MKYLGEVYPASTVRLVRDSSVRPRCAHGESDQPDSSDVIRGMKQDIQDDLLSFPVPSEASLRVLFNLTSAEARLAQRLASGDTVEEVARFLSIKMTTARTQLAAIFDKTNTRRQARLVALLSRVAHVEQLVSVQRTPARVDEVLSLTA